MSDSNATQSTVEKLVLANRILYHKRIVDGFGHISVRHPDDDEKYLLARSMAPGSVSSNDIMTFDLDGTPLGDDQRKPYLERFIHGEIYQKRPDVMSIVHSHSPALIPFGAVPGQSLGAICHMCGFLGTETPVFEIRDSVGEASDMLIRTPELGKSLAESLNNANVVLMRGHGVTVAGSSIENAVFRAIYAELNAQLVMQARQLGEPTFLTKDEAILTTETNESQIGRAWDLWVQEVVI